MATKGWAQVFYFANLLVRRYPSHVMTQDNPQQIPDEANAQRQGAVRAPPDQDHDYLQELAARHFGYERLFAHQLEALTSYLEARDAMVVVPTGSGKSLCYALPAVMGPGLVLVISPLIALIRDQVRKLERAGIVCGALDSLQNWDEKRAVWERLERGELNLLLVSPERLALPSFRERIQAQKLKLIAIDEAHCISQWGFNFRPEYRRIGEYLRDFVDVPKLAVTATATSKVREDIAKVLGMRDPRVVLGRQARDNLEIKVMTAKRVEDQLGNVLQAVLATEGRGIVYASTRRSVSEIHQMLRDAGETSVMYHAGLHSGERAAHQRAFVEGRARVVVSTNAFGMGIDLPDVRFVFHAGMPGSLESYVQEIGRAGRDGLPAKCYLFYGPKDYFLQRFMIDKSFPAEALLRQVHRLTGRFLAAPGSHGERDLLRYLAAQLDHKPDLLLEALEFLYRMDVFVRMELPADPWEPEYQDAVVVLGPQASSEAVWRELACRKDESMHKLAMMHEFTKAAEAGRMSLLERYFQE